MKEKYGDRLDLNILANDSEEARPFKLEGSTQVLFQGEPVPLAMALDRAALDAFLSERL